MYVIKTARERTLISIKSVCANCGITNKIPENIEKSCYRKAIELCSYDARNDQIINRYAELAGNILINLDPLSSINENIADDRRLYRKILSGDLKIVEIADLKFYELNEDPSADDVKLLNKKLNSGIERNYENIPCKFCRQKTVFGYRKQTRSGDEPADELLECDSCGQIYRR